MCGAELKALPDSVQRFATCLQDNGHPHMPVMLDDAARTAQQAADALGVELGQIAKSIIFRRKSDDVAVLVVTSGDRRVDERKVEALVCPDGKRVGRADADFVKRKTGYSIGGVSPLDHATEVVTLIDRSLLRFAEVWAAAGHPHAVFKLMPQDLELLTGAPVVDVAVDLDQEQLAREQAIRLVSARARTLDSCGEDVPSPCISVCRISSESGLCEGCFRTIPEITAWSRSTPDVKRAMWQTIEGRMAALKR
ncbi:MAG: YbaK/EbsC family protein [Polaromonas sp.]|nr:YbaK/EbsC family protein [Polaromonas sp.]